MTTRVKHSIKRLQPHFALNVPILVAFCILANFAGCGAPKSSESIAFRKFVGSHPMLHSPPSHSFRFISLNQAQPEKVSLCWGACDGFRGVIKVANGIGRQSFDGNPPPCDFRLVATELGKLIEWKEFDWINGRNEQYGFGVRPDNKGFTFNGVQQSTKKVVTPSSLPFALVGVKCFIKDVEDEFDITEFSPSESQIFPDSMALKLKHQTNNYSTTVYLNRDRGHCVGNEGFDTDGKMISRAINHYRTDDHGVVPLAQEVFFPDKSGELKHSRSTVFLVWELSDELSNEQCFVSYYGFPEPEFARIRSRTWLAWLAACFAIISIGFIVYRKVNQR